MPRPPRRVASKRTAPIAKPENPPRAVAAASASAATAESSSDVYDISDREKAKVQRRRSTRTANASGKPRTLSNSSAHHAHALQTARHRRDSALDRLENMTSTTSDDANKNSADHSDDSIELGRNSAATPPHGRLTNLSGLDLDDDIFDDLNTTIDTLGPASAQRSNETSTLSTSHFRRRPRAGSFLSRDDGPIRPSSRAGPNTPGLSSTFNIGVFKRRAREPSILGTAQKPQPQRPEPDDGSKSPEQEEHEGDAPEEDEFAPEAESTPFKRSKRHSGDVEAEEVPARVSSRTNLRKRKSEEGHEQRARSSPYANGQSDTMQSIEQSDSEGASDQPSLPPLPRDQIIPSTPVPQEDEEFLAPPLSSDSSEGEAEIWPPLKSLAKGRTKRAPSALRKTPVPDDNTSDISSPPSLTYSPNYPETSPPPRQTRGARRKAAAPKEEPKVTTADLQGMLPRRRQRHAKGDPFSVEDESDVEVDASGLANDEDELSYLDVRSRRRPTRPASRGNASRGRGRAAKQTSASGKGATRTYGRASDKENQDDDEGSLGPVADDDGDGDNHLPDVAVGEELKNARQKFQEVDKWTLEYEEMTQSSSPRGAR